MDTAMDTDSVTESNNVVCFSSSGVNSVTPEWNAFESDIIELLSGVKPASLGTVIMNHQLTNKSNLTF